MCGVDTGGLYVGQSEFCLHERTVRHNLFQYGNISHLESTFQSQVVLQTEIMENLLFNITQTVNYEINCPSN